MTYVEYKQLNPFQRFAHNFKKFFLNIPHALASFFKALNVNLFLCFCTSTTGE